MTKFLRTIGILGAAAAALHVATPPASARQVLVEYTSSEALVTKWIGIASSPNRGVFGAPNQRSEAVARNAAKFACEQETGRTCKAIAVPMSWDVIVMSCARPGRSPLPIVAGSGEHAALEVAFNKAFVEGVNPRNCSQIYSY